MRREEVVKLSFGDRSSRKAVHGHFFRVAGPIGLVVIMMAALLAGAGVGLWPTAAEGASRFLELTDTFEPDAPRHTAYSRLYEEYRTVYPAVAPISHRL